MSDAALIILANAFFALCTGIGLYLKAHADSIAAKTAVEKAESEARLARRVGEENHAVLSQVHNIIDGGGNGLAAKTDDIKESVENLKAEISTIKQARTDA